MTDLILASGSPYRRTLLARLGLEFAVISPDADERSRPSEGGAALSERLALLKARTVADQYPEAVVIGSDQVAECNTRLLGKPGTVEQAIAQLEFCSDQEVVFHTAVVVMGAQRTLVRRVPTRVQMKPLTHRQIRSYVALDQPLDCAGAMKSESLGIALTKTITSDDPTALVGLPLIAVATMLEQLGLPVIDERTQDHPTE